MSLTRLPFFKPVKYLYGKLEKAFPAYNLEFNYLRKYHNYEKDLWLARYFCNSLCSSIDVGVNQGIYSRYLAKFSRHVYGFECNENLLPDIREIQPSNMTLLPFALSHEASSAVLRFQNLNTGIGTIEPANFLSNFESANIQKMLVNTQTLDSFNISDVSFIKIDVEGHELSVLQGASDTLRRYTPALLVEIEERHSKGSTLSVPSFLNSLGYKMYQHNYQNSQLGLIELSTINPDTSVNNFWFIHDKNIAKYRTLRLLH